MDQIARREAPVVLVVDDDLVGRTLVHEALAVEGFSVIEADCGDKALSIFEAHRPDLVVMDALMPGMDGFQACKSLRNLPGGLDVPVLMLTGMEDVEAIARAFEAGAADFATKPIPWQLLTHRVRYLLRAKRAFEALRQSEARLASAQRIARLGHWEQDLGTGDFHWSEQLSEIFGLPAGTLVANLDAALEYVHPDDRDAVRTARAAVSDKKTSRVDFRVLWADDTVRFMHENAEILLDELAEPARVVGTIQDITERKEAEERARYLANYDELTTLANRRLVVDQLGAALARARRASRVVATLFVDLDHFKRINDSLGHAVGDRLLQRITERLRTCVRGSDVVGSAGEADEPSSPVIGRLGGDEFIVVLTDLPHPLDADRVARRILRAIREPLTVEGHEIVVTATIGISLFPNDGHDVDTLLRNADAAMYHAKERGRDDHQFYDLSMNATAIERLTLETELHRALEEDQFRLYFQPQVDSRTGYVTGAEALLRWQHPSRGLLAPEIFVALAEETGLIVPIGEWIVREACAQAKAWNDAGHGPLRVAINLSARQFKRSDLRAMIEQTVEAAGLSPALLELEITEGVVMEPTGENVATIRALRAKGFRIAVDDFGTGYSSLSCLTRLPIDRVKIDRSFVHNVLTDSQDAALSTAIVAMAGALRLECVAVGVESQDQAEFLVSLGCQYLQGYFISPPLSAEDLTRRLQASTATHAAPLPRSGS